MNSFSFTEQITINLFKKHLHINFVTFSFETHFLTWVLNIFAYMYFMQSATFFATNWNEASTDRPDAHKKDVSKLVGATIYQHGLRPRNKYFLQSQLLLMYVYFEWNF